MKDLENMPEKKIKKQLNDGKKFMQKSRRILDQVSRKNII